MVKEDTLLWSIIQNACSRLFRIWIPTIRLYYVNRLNQLNIAQLLKWTDKLMSYVFPWHRSVRTFDLFWNNVFLTGNFFLIIRHFVTETSGPRVNVACIFPLKAWTGRLMLDFTACSLVVNRILTLLQCIYLKMAGGALKWYILLPEIYVERTASKIILHNK